MPKYARVFIVFLCCATAMADGFSGTWKLDLQKSKLRNANISGATLTIEQTGPTSYRTTLEVTLTSGEKQHVAFNRICDGIERKVDTADSGSFDDSEMCEFVAGGRKITMKKDGKVVATISSTLSTDGQTLINRRSDAQGEELHIYDREK